MLQQQKKESVFTAESCTKIYRAVFMQHIDL